MVQSTLRCFVLCFLLLGLLLNAAFAQDPEDEVGKIVVEALRTQNFDLLLPIIPDKAVLEKLMAVEQAEDDRGEPGSITPEKAAEMLRDKLHSEFDVLLKSAKDKRVKLKKLTYSKVLAQSSYPVGGQEMSTVEIKIVYKGKSLKFTFTTVEFQGKSYYAGTLMGTNLFGQVRE